jgi:hypothetical protein
MRNDDYELRYYRYWASCMWDPLSYPKVCTKKSIRTKHKNEQLFRPVGPRQHGVARALALAVFFLEKCLPASCGLSTEIRNDVKYSIGNCTL